MTIAVDATGAAALRVIDARPGRRPRPSASGSSGASSAARERRGAGFGLGLAIARGLARQMGGDVRALPAERGAHLLLTLPECPVPAGVAMGRGYDGSHP